MTAATLTRRPDWRGRYEAVIDEIMATPFDWASHDCVRHFAGRIVYAITGVALVAQFAGSYDDAVSAYRLIRDAGFTDLAEMVGSMLSPIHPSRARLGDLAAIRTDGPIGFGLGVVNGERILVLTETGIGTVDLLDAEICFEVGSNGL